MFLPALALLLGLSAFSAYAAGDNDAPGTWAQSLHENLPALDRLLADRLETTAHNARSLKRSLTVTYRQQVLDHTLPKLRRRAFDASALAIDSLRLPPGPSRTAKLREAGTLYQAVLVASQVVQLEVTMMQIADVADEQGQSSLQIASQFRAFEADMRPLLEAAQSLDPAKLAAAIPDGMTRYEAWLSFSERWGVGLKKGERWSRTAVLAADMLMLAVSASQLATMAASASTSPSFNMRGAPGGAVVTSQVDIAAIAQTSEAIRKLIAAGALDPAIIAGLSTIIGTRLHTTQTPVAMHMGANESSPSSMAKVQKVNGRLPVNSEYAGKTYPLENLPESLRKKYPNSVRFTEDGFPDFRPYAIKEVKVQGLRGNTHSDFTLSNRAAGLDETPAGFTWHHHQDKLTMQLVPSDLHRAVAHTGGRALLCGR